MNTAEVSVSRVISRQEAKTKGLKRYYTGKPCSKGHVDERLVSNGKCRTCGKADVIKFKERNPDRVAAGMARYHAGLRAQCFSVLGSKCACCHEQELVFLCIDHKNGNGNEHRRSLGIFNGTGGARFFKWLLAEIKRVGRTAVRKHFRILCANCNHAHAILGYCPHKRKLRGKVAS